MLKTRRASERRGVERRPSRCNFRSLYLLLLALGTVVSSPAAAAENVWETYSDQVYTLQPRESMQIRTTYDDIQVRSWKLIVDGGRERCDLSVLRVRGETLHYFKNDESRHEVLVPWGVGEEIIAVVTNRDHQATYTISLLGPPRDQIHAAYGYHVNRALEAFTSGRSLEAEHQCRLALKDDADDGVAKVLLAGLLRDRQLLDEAAALVEEAMAGALSPDMRTLAEDLRAELRLLRAPLPLPVRQGVEDAEADLVAGRPAEALEVCEKLLDGSLRLDATSRALILSLQGRSLSGLDRNFEAIDAFTQALAFNRNRALEAVIYFHMGNLFVRMGNLAQAEGSFTMALGGGLPGALELKAREELQSVQERLAAER